MNERNKSLQEALYSTLIEFSTLPHDKTSKSLLKTLGYQSDKSLFLGKNSEEFLSNIESFKPELGPIDRVKVIAEKWSSCSFLFQITNDEIPTLSMGNIPANSDSQVQKNQINSFVFISIELKGDQWGRSQLTAITRELNKRFPMPAIIIFHYQLLLTIAIIDRRENLLDPNLDVLNSRISIIKDVQTNNPHRAHIDILSNLAISNLSERKKLTNFRELYDSWLSTLSIQILNQSFYKQLSWWYLWAVKKVDFPKGGGADRNSIGVIRLLTRIIFVWFIKERGIVTKDLFDINTLKNILKDNPLTEPIKSNYYQGILQNLFFATLNQEMGEGRQWSQKNSDIKEDYLIQNKYRYEEFFINPELIINTYFSNIPYLNGGLFECLDKQVTEDDIRKRPELITLCSKEGNHYVLRIDGFSRRSEAQAIVPNMLFFGGTIDADLDTELNFETNIKKRQYPVKGLIDILNSYKFTIDENTPLDEEVALDPELLGKVFENLLASYNPDTSITARKQSGSFYTPRIIVDYMVDEALIPYLAKHINAGNNRHEELRTLLSHADTNNTFSVSDSDVLVQAIKELKILDPACGSGAFPMGVLGKLLIALKKLDPKNIIWEKSKSENSKAPTVNNNTNPQHVEYMRKLYLIEKCIFGTDIQPIAVQITKLRFFISLILNQPIDSSKANWNITPLPNLETKIVSANSLKNVPRKTVQSSLLSNPEIINKEFELRNANAGYFTSSNHIRKKKYKQEVQRIHTDLVNLLKNDGLLSHRDSERMASWDPFDQNSTSDFFDIEWMFGLPLDQNGGEGVFDIIIGNPPYIKEFTFKEAFKDLKDSKYYQGKMDLWYMFTCRALDLLKVGTGIVSFIATNNWTTNAGASIMRSQLAQRATLLKFIDFGNYKIFGSADIQTMILVAENNSSKSEYSFDLRRLNKLNGTSKDITDLLTGSESKNIESIHPLFNRTKFIKSTFLFSSNKIEGILSQISEKRNFILKKEEVCVGIDVHQDYVNNKSAKILESTAKIGDGIFILSNDEKNSLNLNSNELNLIRPYYTSEKLFRYFGDKTNDKWIIYTDSSFKNSFKIQPYPNIKRHLDKFTSVITSDNAPYGLHRSRDDSFFNEGNKIVSLRKCALPSFTFVDYPCYVSQTFNIIKTNRIDLIFLTGFLNSSVIAFWLKNKGKLQGNLYQIDKEPLMSVPIFKPENFQITIIATIVKYIITLNKVQHKNYNSKFEQLINGLIYEIFFPDILHQSNIKLFDECIKSNILSIDNFENHKSANEIIDIATLIFSNDHKIYSMLFDLQTISLIRTIEGKE